VRSRRARASHPLLFPIIVVALLVPTAVSHGIGQHRLDRMFGVAVTSVVTLELIASVVPLVTALPSGRETREGHASGAFLFPQMTLLPEARRAAGQDTWSPNFLDYLFLAFNTSTAFSPTDTPALARWGKALMMLQSLLSLTVLALLAARAVNIL
jgi:hypothetical protein